MNRKRMRKGFTLVELAIVIAILGILAVVAIPKYQDMVQDARSATAKAQLATVRSAIAITYAKQRGVFPKILAGALANASDASIFAEGVTPKVDIGGATNSSTVVVLGTPAANITTGGWMYEAATGRVIINSSMTDPATTFPWSSY